MPDSFVHLHVHTEYSMLDGAAKISSLFTEAQRLEAAGLLRRERDPQDQRNLALALTDRGKALREQAEKIPAGIVQRLGMPVDELVELHGVLTRVIGAAQRALAAPDGHDAGAAPAPAPAA